MAPASTAFVAALPKLELHMHIEGGLTPRLRFALAARNGIPQRWATADEAAADYDRMFHESLDGSVPEEEGARRFFDAYYGGMEVLRTEEDFYDLAMEYYTRCERMKVRYCETFFDPQAHTRRGVALDAVMKGLRRAKVEAEEKLGLTCRWIMCFLRDEPVSSAMETYAAALPYRDMIHGIGLDSNEYGRGPLLFDDLYKRARADGFHLTAHCDVNVTHTHAHIRDVVCSLGGTGIGRVDHGLNAAEDDELLALVKERRVGLTGCPYGVYTYLFHRKNEDALFQGMFRKLLDAGVLLTINSDDPAYMGDNWLVENILVVVEKCGLTKEEVIRLQRNAVEISWAPKAMKSRILEEIEDFVGSFEDS